MHCNDFRDRLRSYLREELEGEARRDVREHLEACAECRRRALAEEPSLLFATLPRTEADPGRVEECTAAVDALIRNRRLERRSGSRRRPWLAAAAATVLVVAGGLLWQTRPGDEPAVPDAVVADESTREAAPPPRVEVDMEGSDVRVYHFAGGDGDDTAVAFVVNPAMEL